MRQLTVVIPTYNEAENLPSLIEKLIEISIPDLKLIIVDDGSPDGTGEMAEELAEQMRGNMSVVHRAGKLGLGSAYLRGFGVALSDGAQAIGQMDADFSHSPSYLPEFLGWARSMGCCVWISICRGRPGRRTLESWAQVPI